MGSISAPILQQIIRVLIAAQMCYFQGIYIYIKIMVSKKKTELSVFLKNTTGETKTLPDLPRPKTHRIGMSMVLSKLVNGLFHPYISRLDTSPK